LCSSPVLGQTVETVLADNRFNGLSAIPEETVETVIADNRFNGFRRFRRKRLKPLARTTVSTVSENSGANG